MQRGARWKGMQDAVGVAIATAVSGAALLIAPGLAWASGDASESSCPSSTESSPGFRTYLPDCRAYELVTPPYKEGGEGQRAAPLVSEDGEHVIEEAEGIFAGEPNFDEQAMYMFSRTASGWQPTALMSSASERELFVAASAADNLATTLWEAKEAGQVFRYFLRLPDGATIGVGRAAPQDVLKQVVSSRDRELEFAGASRDLNHLLFWVEQNDEVEGHGNLWPGDSTTANGRSLYEYVGPCASESECEAREPVLVGVKNHGALQGSPHGNEGAELISTCGTELGGAESTKRTGDMYNAVSASGETVFFTARACKGEPAVNELYARIGGRETVAISEPSKADCAQCQTAGEATLENAVFQGASENGEKVFFLTEQELFEGQKGVNLYEYDFGAPAGERIKLVSSEASEPKVQGVVRVSESGEYIYFVAESVLSGKNGEGNTPDAEPESDNLYVYDTAVAGGKPVFVGTLMSATLEARIDSELGSKATSWLAPIWQQTDQREAQATPNGRFLVFPSWADLTADDTSTLPQLFEYDVQTERLTRVSIGQDGYREDGNLTLPGGDSYKDVPHIPTQSFLTPGPLNGPFGPATATSRLALTFEGRQVFFTSAAELVPGATSGEPNVFEYENGNVYLVSDGADAAIEPAGLPAVWLLGTTESGDDVFFGSSEQLVPQDGETLGAIYDARIEGGFPAPEFAPSCLGEVCRGRAAAQLRLASAATSSQAPGGNLARKHRSKHGGRVHRHKRRHHKHRRHRHHHVTRRGK